jgi:hypothetical protein
LFDDAATGGHDAGVFHEGVVFSSESNISRTLQMSAEAA